jgi:sulfotransferase
MTSTTDKPFKKFIALAGLPRSGSTLLSSILSQNPKIHSEGTSSVAQFMWDLECSRLGGAHELLIANNKEHIAPNIIKDIPSYYYQTCSRDIVVDKNRLWTLPLNLKMFKDYIDPTPKIIVLERPIIEIVNSFYCLLNGKTNDFSLDELLTEGSDPLMRALRALNFAKQNNEGEYLFMEYKDLVNRPHAILNKIYHHCQIEYFEHRFDNIVTPFPEDDVKAYGVPDFHYVRPTLGIRQLPINLPDYIVKRCEELEDERLNG